MFVSKIDLVEVGNGTCERRGKSAVRAKPLFLLGCGCRHRVEQRGKAEYCDMYDGWYSMALSSKLCIRGTPC